MELILPIRKIKGAARQCYGDSDGVAWRERALNHRFLALWNFHNI